MSFDKFGPNEYLEIIFGLLVPFIGTALGSACVFFMRKAMSSRIKHALAGFAGGVMVAASVWSLIIPAIESSAHLGRLSFIPAVVGIMLGVLFLCATDPIIQRINKSRYASPTERSDSSDVLTTSDRRSSMLFLAVTLHNFPEGMAVGVAFAASIYAESRAALTAATVLAIGIAIQDFPEGAIISMPLAGNGMKKSKAFLLGTLSGLVEPLGAVLTILAASLVLPILPYLLCFAAGAMLYVVAEELIPEIHEDEHSTLGVIMFAVGFSVMMMLDVALG